MGLAIAIVGRQLQLAVPVERLVGFAVAFVGLVAGQLARRVRWRPPALTSNAHGKRRPVTGTWGTGAHRPHHAANGG